MNNSTNYVRASAFIALLIVALMAAIFLIFHAKGAGIIALGLFHVFMVLAILAAGFLLGLLYLANNSGPRRHEAVRKSRKKKRTSR